nr:aspartate-rich protein 1-like [Symphalangus syndactylus]
MGNILSCCGSSSCGWRKRKVASCDESDIYEAVAAKSESAAIEPGKLDVGATEGQDLQHISNQKTPTGPPENCLSLKFLPPSEEDNDDAQILPSPVQACPEDNLSLVCLPGNEDYDGDDDGDHDDAQILPSPVQDGCYHFDTSCSSPEDNLSLICLPRSEDDDCDHDDVQILPSPVRASPEDNLILICLPQSEDDDCDDDDVQILLSPIQDWPEDRLFLRCLPRYKDEDDDDDVDAHITAQKESDLTLESLSDEEIHPAQ